MVMKVLCLGNNHKHTDELTSQLGKNHGLITNTNIDIKDGFYHTSVLDLTNSEILELAQKFDRIIVLDQPIDQWNHPSEFHATQDIAKRIGDKASWQNKAGKLQLEYWQNLVETNKSFCIFPFIELLTQNGHTTLCCRSDTPVQSIDKLKNFATDEEYATIRNAMLAGKSLPEHCKVCYKLEDKSIISARQEETVEWAMRLDLKTVDDLGSVIEPVYYEVRPSNTCNLMCRMCAPIFSSLIEKEQKQLGKIPQEYTEEYSNFDIVKIENIVKLYVAGGEPTAMPEFYDFLRKCVRRKYTDFEFIVNTNAMKVSTLLLELGSHFKNLQYIISIDGYKKHNDYSRWRSKWETIIKNAHLLQDNGHKIHFNTVLSLWTVFDYHKLIHFLDREFPDCLIHGQYANLYSPFVFEYSQDQIRNLESICTTKIYNNNAMFKSFIDGTIAGAKQSHLNKTAITKFFSYNDELDTARSSRLNDYIPELEQLRIHVDKSGDL
jgi:uncharacterized Fe-S cluster-containing radical SAM superfamily protein